VTTTTTELTHSLFVGIHTLPKAEAKALLKALRNALPLNRRLKKSLRKAEDAADSADMADWLTQQEYEEGW